MHTIRPTAAAVTMKVTMLGWLVRQWLRSAGMGSK